MSDLTLVIPAKNEAECLPVVLKELEKFDFKIIIVMEESDKQTKDSIEHLNHKIYFQKKLGYGSALIEGIEIVETKYFCIFNADGSFNPNEIQAMLNKVKNENLDFIFGSRYEKNGKSDDDTIITLIGNYFFTILGNILFRLKISDILYTFVVGKTLSAKNLSLNKKDFGFCIELPIKAKRSKMVIDSITSHERGRIAGFKKVNAFKDGSLILIYMIKLFLKKN